jgi:hypothetical protein
MKIGKSISLAALIRDKLKSDAQYIENQCYDWSGGVYQVDSEEIKCGSPTHLNWFDDYVYRSSNLNLGIRGTWAVELDRWSGILHMNGIVGNLVLVSNKSGIAEQRMVLEKSSDGGYILYGEVIAMHNIGEKYHANHIYIQNFSKSFSAKSCDNKICSDAIFSWLSDRS